MNFAIFADSKPDETIKPDPLGCLSIAALNFSKGYDHLIVPPFRQHYKRSPNTRHERALRLAEWISQERTRGLHIRGFFGTHAMESAARFGLEMIQETPGIEIEEHYNSYRLRFDDQTINLPSAVAMGYYHFIIAFSVLRMNFPPNIGRIDLSVYLDRFPGASGTHAQRPELRFLKYLEQNSPTGATIRQDEESMGIYRRLTELEYWKPNSAPADQAPKKGKTHPHFMLVDWFVASAIAERFPEPFVASYRPSNFGYKAVDAMRELFSEFKECGPIFSFADDNTLDHIVGGTPQWEMPDDAREFIMRRATKIQEIDS